MTQPLTLDLDTHGPRTHTCGELSEQDIGKEVVLKGWVDTRRDLGGLIFIDLRDRYGLTQIVFSPQDDPEAHRKAERLHSEDVISVRGTVVARSPETVNPKLPTGRIEVRVHEVLLLNRAEPLPFSVSAHEEKVVLANEELRLKYRYLDLRRRELQRNIILRHEVSQITRRYFSEHSFLEIETPFLTKSTPEGARDFLVPSRLYPGKFYALPQSPQLYKQILMVAGMDRYFQIVRCFRDEDLRADRQPEFTQIDVEISFATEEMVFDLIEGLMQRIWKEVKGVDLPRPFPRMTYDEAIRRYGSDKPDVRFGLELHDLSDVFRGSPFRVFEQTLAQHGAIVGIVVPGEGHRGRGAMDRLDREIVRKRIGAGGLVYFKLDREGNVYSSVKSHILPETYVQRAIEALQARPGDLVLILAGPVPRVFEQMGTLRLYMAQDVGLIPRDGEDAFLWVTDFPLLEWDEEEGRWVALHHPFTSPQPQDLPYLMEDPARVRSRAYDLVLNGSEIGGGSIRIHRPDIQAQIFKLLNIPDEEARRRFGFLLEAFKYGAPPHGGIALGLDRIVMLLAGASSLRDVIPFPKTQRAQELMTGAPDVVDPEQLQELHIQVVLPEEETTR